jgi:YebC/PmpR family DNA-binding regulatory protein
MAGHSQYSNIVHRKNAQDKKRAKIFSKLAREITVAARTSPDPSMNPALRSAIQAARAQNMPKDRIERAISSAAGKDSTNYEEMRYEGFGPGGIALIVEALTDNRNRTASEVRSAFQKHGGTLGESGSVAYMFERIGLVRYLADAASADGMLEAAIEAGADDCSSDDEGHEIVCAPDDLNTVGDALEKILSAAASTARLEWRPTNTIAIGEDHAGTLFKLLDVLDDNDDVQRVFANFEVDEAVLEKLGA